VAGAAMSSTAPALAGLRCHGLDVSYYTGKVEAFLRYRGIPHTRVELSTRRFAALERRTGLRQMPAIELPDGRWMSDSTPIIEYLDAAWPGPRVMPEDPLQLFMSQLLEDYADEFLWRPAMYYRWHFEPDARLASHRIATEMMHDVPLPLPLRRALIRRRQYRLFVAGEGVTAANRNHVESIYTRTLAQLQAILCQRPFLLGGRPSLADFGFFASMFRHFSLDPTPARLMRDTAPAVYEWVARLWNARADRVDGELHPAGSMPDDWRPLLRMIGALYLPSLNANAAAFAAGARHAVLRLEDHSYRIAVHRYRVWCLERLQRLFAALPDQPRLHVEAILRACGAFEPLFALPPPRSGFDPDARAPFFTPGRIWQPA